MGIRTAKRSLTITLFIVAFVEIAGLQPLFFGVRTYFGIDPRLILLPISFVFLVFMFLHLYQNWSLLLSWFRKSPDKKKLRNKMQRMIILMLLVVVLGIDLTIAWSEALTKGMDEISFEAIRAWSWVATLLLAVHVWQRWRITWSYFKPRYGKKEQTSD